MSKLDTQDMVVQILRRLRVSPSYLGMRNLVDAVVLCCEDPEALSAVTKWVYPAVAQMSHTKWKNVEFNLRTVRDTIWKRGDREFLNELAGFEVLVRPSVGELLGFMTYYIYIRKGSFCLPPEEEE